MFRSKLLKKGQVWVLDVFFGILIFTVTLSIFFKSEVNFSDSDERVFDELLFESKLVSDSLMSKGCPFDWTQDNVSTIGITDNYRINNTKLSQLKNMSYSLTKSRLRTKYDYYFFFENVDGVLRISASEEGVGKLGVNSTNVVTVEDPHNLVKVSRFVIFRSQLVKMVVYLWD